MEFVYELVVRSASTVTEWVAALNHESFDYAVENRTVVQLICRLLTGLGSIPRTFAFGELNEVLRGLRRVIRK